MFVYHGDATRSRFSYLGLVRLDKAVKFARYGLGRFVLRFGYRLVYTADFAVDFGGCLQPHRIRDMRLDIQRGFRANVTYDIG